MKPANPEQQVYFDMMRDLKTLIQLFDLQMSSPQVITNEILQRGKEKLHSLLSNVETIQQQRLMEQAESMKTGQTPPYVLIEELAGQYSRVLQIDLQISDEMPILAMPDQIFALIVRGLMVCAVKTQFGVQRKSCELTANAYSRFMILKFKDFSSESMTPKGKQVLEDQVAKLKQHAMKFGGDLSLNESIGRFRDYILIVPFAS